MGDGMYRRKRADEGIANLRLPASVPVAD